MGDTPIRSTGADTFLSRLHSTSRQATLTTSRLSGDTQWVQVASLFLVSKPMKFGSGGRIVAGGVLRQLKHPLLRLKYLRSSSVNLVVNWLTFPEADLTEVDVEDEDEVFPMG